MPSPFATPSSETLKRSPRPSGAEQTDDSPGAPLRVLVADDDSSSRRFFTDGLATLGAHAQSCGNGREALALARGETFDLLLLDCRMPGAGALEILTMLRRDAMACSGDALAVATSAELSTAQHQPLVAAGFSDILMKPCGLDELRQVLALASDQDMAILDDGAALVTTGDATTMRALRLLLREELAVLRHDLDTLSGNREAFSDRLHRLRSSCGFCGAAALLTQTALLQRQLARAGNLPMSLTRFRQALLATLQLLDQ